MIDKFKKVDDHVYRGSAPSKEDLLTLKNKYGVDTIVSLDSDVAHKIAPTCKVLNLKHIIFPIDGIEPEVNKVQFLLNQIQDSDHTTFVHCKFGKDRSSMICAMYRLISGWSLNDALLEAANMGMGKNLPKNSRDRYYSNVINFSKALQKDSNKANDSIDFMNNIQDSITTPQQYSSVSVPMQNETDSYLSFAPYSSSETSSLPTMNISASSRIYTHVNSSDLLKPGYWNARPQAVKRHHGGKLFSADISSASVVQKFKQYFNKNLFQMAKMYGADVVFFEPGVIYVFNPNALINIKEENDDLKDSNLADSFPDVGGRANYGGVQPYVFPGSGGIMESGYGGFAGMVQLPFGNSTEE